MARLIVAILVMMAAGVAVSSQFVAPCRLGSILCTVHESVTGTVTVSTTISPTQDVGMSVGCTLPATLDCTLGS